MPVADLEVRRQSRGGLERAASDVEVGTRDRNRFAPIGEPGIRELDSAEQQPGLRVGRVFRQYGVVGLPGAVIVAFPEGTEGADVLPEALAKISVLGQPIRRPREPCDLRSEIHDPFRIA